MVLHRRSDSGFQTMHILIHFNSPIITQKIYKNKKNRRLSCYRINNTDVYIYIYDAYNTYIHTHLVAYGMNKIRRYDCVHVQKHIVYKAP
jgi:hypothetical protein